MARYALRLTTAALAAVALTLPSAAASAAPAATERPAVAQQVTCDAIKRLAAPLLAAGLPLETVVNQIFNLLNGQVPVDQIRACLTP
ncbi:MAG TPA: hypothetical protein VNV66_06470 [Pilimelia sp.]|nr:hypothetical protein [Pilimelia sp.]